MQILLNKRKLKASASDDAAPVVSEWRFVIAVVFLVLVVTSVPYFYAYRITQPDKVFMGLMLDVPDHAQYFSWMRELSTAFLSANKLTPEPNKPVFFNLLWWTMGRLNRLLGLGFAGMFQLLRLTASTLFLLLVYKVCMLFLEDRWMRRIAFLVVAFTSGFGWVLVLLKYTFARGELLFPLDVYIAEGNTFLGMLGYPHFIAAALYIFVFYLVLQGQAKKQLRYAVAAGLFAFLWGWQHAYDLILVYGILGLYTAMLVLRDRRLPIYLIKADLIIGVLSWWPALYSVILTKVDPLWEQVLAQFVNAGVFTPNLLHLPILLGVAFFLALFTFIKDNPLHLDGDSDKDLFVKSWFLGNFLLIYIPTDYQVHMLNGWQVPIAILATQGLFRYLAPFVVKSATKIKRELLDITRVQHVLGVLLVIIILPTNLYLWTWRFVDLSRQEHPYYLYKDEVAAFIWLEDNAKPDDVVLSSLTIGQYIPAWTGTHAFLAHWAQTVNFYEKSAMVESFFSANTDDAKREAILQAYSVDYIFYGPVEKSMGSFDPETEPYLKRVFTSPLVQLYKVESQ